MNINHDVVRLTGTISNVFSIKKYQSHEICTAKINFLLKDCRGLAFFVRKSLDFDFTETDIGHWLKTRGDIIDYALGLYYVPCESSRHWDKNIFDDIQEDIACFKRQSCRILLMGTSMLVQDSSTTTSN